MTDSPRKQTIFRIVITGGPCAGKTTAMSWIQNAFTQKGWLVLFVDETATQLSSGGAPWKLTRNNREYQYRVTQLMLAKEEVFTEVARTFEADKVLVVCDRGALDNRAYMTDEEFRYVQEKLNMTEVELRDHYDAVFHLVTAAKGAEEFYTFANNAARYETPEEAVRSDDSVIAAWTGHPHLRVIDNRYEDIRNFEEYLYRNNVRTVKIFLHVSKEEQARRFLSRIEEPEKNWKFSGGDYEERAYWDAYQEAFESAISATATEHCPWYVVPADHKWYMRYVVSEIILATLKDMDPRYPEVTEERLATFAKYKEELLKELPPEDAPKPKKEKNKNKKKK